MFETWAYIEFGFWHVFDVNALDHLYFLVLLSMPYTVKQWQYLIWLVSLFTLGHGLSLLATYEEWVNFPEKWIEIMIALTIAVSCFVIIVSSGKRKKTAALRLIEPMALVFGLIHGLGFGNYFRIISVEENVYYNLIQFALGIELAQILITLTVGIVNLLVFSMAKANIQKYQHIVSAMILSQVVELIITNIA